MAAAQPAATHYYVRKRAWHAHVGAKVGPEERQAVDKGEERWHLLEPVERGGKHRKGDCDGDKAEELHGAAAHAVNERYCDEVAGQADGSNSCGAQRQLQQLRLGLRARRAQV